MYSMTFHEKKQHGTLEFPAAYYYIDSSHPQYNMPFHWHKEWELIRIIKGSFTIHADNRELTASAGDILLLQDSMLHGGTPCDCVYDCLVFDLHSLFRSFEPIKKYLRPIYRMEILPDILYKKEENPSLYALVTALMEANARADAVTSPSEPGDLESPAVPMYTQTPVNCHELITVSSLGSLFAYILQNGRFTVTQKETIHSSHRIGQIKSVLEYIEQQYQNEITLTALAEVAGMNPKYFCRIFKEITQQTPMDYVIFFRIEQAAKLLSSTDLSVIETGMECGFNDCSYFIRTFKRLKNMTPNQYRKNNLYGNFTPV